MKTFKTNHPAELKSVVQKITVIIDDDPSGAVSSMPCFADQSHFNRVFKEFTGFTPREYLEFYRRTNGKFEESKLIPKIKKTNNESF